MALQRSRKDATMDYNLRLKDAGAISATAAAQVGGVDKILDMGNSRYEGRVVVDVTACEVDTANEGYKIWVQVSNSATFASTIFIVGGLSLGDLSVSLESIDTAATRHQEIMFCNEVNGTVYRYLRLYTVVIGTIAAGGINYSANLVKATT